LNRLLAFSIKAGIFASYLNQYRRGRESPLSLNMEITEQISDWASGILEGDIFLVEVEMKAGSRKISVFIDGAKGVTIDDCRKLSRALSEKLDEMDYGAAPYQFEVSSPGVDRPLKLQAQYGKHIGRELLVKLKAGGELLGKLERVDDGMIGILLKDKKKRYHQAPEKEIKMEDIGEAIVQVSFR
jgi:ribosome maturation factor RimP